ncbi:transcriptional repressor NrdR [Fibrobacterales bacterium]|nr:transcriptional repressor NrdR [Fibrobacterales bacterium]
MKCPHCKEDDDKVIDTRMSGDSVRRRRECLKCGNRFTTYEYVEKAVFSVVKRGGRREAYSREKLRTGIEKACAKRPISDDKINEIVSDVENLLVALEKSEVSYDVIGTLIMQELSKVDPVAYVRFASVYREFREVGEFVKLVEEKPKQGNF